MMKSSTYYKLLVGIPFILLFINEVKAQNTRNFFSITGGYSLPVGELARKKVDDPFAGLAGAGYYGQANYDFRIARWIGIRVSGSMNLNKTNSGPIIEKANQYAQALGKTFSWQSDVSTWKLNAAMIGPAIYINMGRVQLEGHVQGGFIKADSPSVNLIGAPVAADGRPETDGQLIYVDLKSATTKTLGLAAGASFRFPIFKSLFFQLSGDVIGAQAEIKDVAIKAKWGTFEYTDNIKEKRFIGVVNVGAGLGLAF